MASQKLFFDLTDDTPVHCDSCPWTGFGEALAMIDRPGERLEPGSEIPAGECPDCGALAYLDKEEPPQAEVAAAPPAKDEWLVWSIEHNKWWKAGRRGYSVFMHEAGVYTQAQAEDICKGANFAHHFGHKPNETMVRAPATVYPSPFEMEA